MENKHLFFNNVLSINKTLKQVVDPDRKSKRLKPYFSIGYDNLIKM